jgi:hypothetical protein
MMIVGTVYIHTDHLGDFRRIYYRRTGLAGEGSSRRLKAMRSASGQLTVGQHRQAQEQIAGAAGQDGGWETGKIAVYWREFPRRATSEGVAVERGMHPRT